LGIYSRGYIHKSVKNKMFSTLALKCAVYRKGTSGLPGRASGISAARR
jgi:hypothetical protein